MSDTTSERRVLRSKWPDAFDDGVRCGLMLPFAGPRDSGGYPQGFRQWPLEKRNAWFSGLNVGLLKREATHEES